MGDIAAFCPPPAASFLMKSKVNALIRVESSGVEPGSLLPGIEARKGRKHTVKRSMRRVGLIAPSFILLTLAAPVTGLSGETKASPYSSASSYFERLSIYFRVPSLFRMKDFAMHKQSFLRGRILEGMLCLTAGAFVAGHLVNRFTSPRPLNPLWNRISAFAASRYGGTYVTAGIVMFAICLLLLGVIAFMQCDKSLLARAGSICIAASSLPMALIAAFPTFTPGGEIVSKRAVPFLWPMRGAAPALAERVSDHWHNVSSAVAFTLLLAGILLLSVSLLKEGKVKRLGQSGIFLFSVMIILLAMTYKGRYYNGSWQRMAFLLLFFWILFGAICFRKGQFRAT